jgi:LacI family transcriptional regulator
LDVAHLAGVSTATASRVLGNSRPVGAELRQRVLDSAAKLGYAPNPHARALARSRDASVGVIVNDVSDPYFSEIIRGILDGAQAGGRMLLICNTYQDAERELAYIRHFRAQRVDALLLAASGRLDREFENKLSAEIIGFEQAGGRAVMIGRHEAAGDAVLPDNTHGARQMARHLVGLGHRKIGVIAGPSMLTTVDDRVSGFRQELSSLGVPLLDDQVCYGNFDRSQGEQATVRLLDAMPGLTAIFALNDVMAIGALAFLRHKGIRVPDEVSVAGFDDIPIVADLSPALTTIRVPMVDIGQRAYALALEPAPPNFRTVHLPTELIVRESTQRVGR